jgi:glutamyl-tRNA reductase
MSVIALGLSHETAPVDLRGRFVLPRERLLPSLQAIRRERPEIEVAIVSTCNRTELYLGAANDASVEGARALAGDGIAWLASTGGVSADRLRSHLYVHEDELAARHAFRLASGLESMVVGETQILGQMKQAIRDAGEAGTLGATLHQLFQRSFAVAKEVRSGTEVGMHTVSLAAATVRLARRVFEDFRDLHVLFVGAGEMAAPVLAHVAAQSPRRLTVANRNVDRGEAVALRFGASAIGLSAALDRLEDFDVVVSCTASTVPVIGLGAVQRAMKARRRRPMLMVDLAVPRDIEPEVVRVPDVYLYSMDELSRVVRDGGDRRLAAVADAESIVETGVQDFVRWMGVRESVPLIHALQERAEAWRGVELQRARRLLARGEDPEAVLEALARGLTQKMLHGPMAGLHATDGEDREALAATLTSLFLECPVRGPGRGPIDR